MIKTIIFDIGNVLTVFAWEEFLNSFGFSEDITEKIARASINSEVWKEYDLGIQSDKEIVENFIKNAPDIEKEIRTVYQKAIRNTRLLQFFWQ